MALRGDSKQPPHLEEIARRLQLATLTEMAAGTTRRLGRKGQADNGERFFRISASRQKQTFRMIRIEATGRAPPP
jgi:hypothetical protein